MVDSRDLVAFASNAAFAVDENSCVVGWNDAARDLLGYSADEVNGRHCYDILRANLASGEPLCTPMCEGAMCFKRRQPFSVPSCRLRSKDGQWFAASIGTLIMPRETGVQPADAAVAIVLLREVRAASSEGAEARPLRIYTLGRFGLTLGGRGLAVDSWRRKQASTLLKYLVAHEGRPVHRERLGECLWPEADEGRGWGRLKVTISFLRHQLRAAGMEEDVVETVGKSYMLRRDGIWVDAHEFERLVSEGTTREREGRPRDALKRYQEAQSLYRGDYLEEDLYADWCAEERQRLRERYLDMLAGLADCHAACGHLAEAAQVCRTALCFDPSRESFLRALLENLVHLGRPDWAEAEFRHWQRVFSEDLGIELMPETRLLRQQLLDPIASLGLDKGMVKDKAS